MRELFKKIKLKKNNRSGFTFMETLIAVLILLMVSAVVAAGVPSAANAYKKVVVSSNAEVLLSTTISMLRNEIGTAENVKTPTTEPNTVYYHNAATGSTSKIYKGTNDRIMYQRYAIDPDSQLESSDSNTTTPEPLVSSGAATDDMFVTYNTVTYSGGVVTFNDIKVMQIIKGSGTKEVTSLKDPLVIRII